MTDIDSFRAFNRFHTRLAGALNEHLHESDYSLPQLRVLYEIAQAAEAPSASELRTSLGMDAGFLSRIVSSLEFAGLIARTPSPENAKRLALATTGKGREFFAALVASSNREVEALLAPLSGPQRRDLVAAMTRIRRLLGDLPKGDVVLRDPIPGDMGTIVARQAQIYAGEYGWDWTFEALVAEIAAKFVRDFKRGRERCWVAEQDGEVVGSVFVVEEDAKTAKLRMLYVDAAARGQGIGHRLVDECLRFATDAGYGRMVLWTNDVLVSARRIYEAAGFELIDEERHHSFGKDLVGQYWGRDL